MAIPTMLPVTAALAIAGTIAGVHLGRSAIAEIDPAHFEHAGNGRFFADLVPGGYRPSKADYVRYNDFWADEASIPAEPECDRCGQYVEPAEFSMEADYPSVDIGAYAQAAALPQPAIADRAELLPADIQRYATFPITSEEAERRRAPPSGQTARLDEAGPERLYPSDGQTEEAVPIGM